MSKTKMFISILTVLCLFCCMAIPSFAADAGGGEDSGVIEGGDTTTEDTTTDSDTPWYEFIADVFLTVAELVGTVFYIIWEAFTGFFGLFDGINDGDGPFQWLNGEVSA